MTPLLWIAAPLLVWLLWFSWRYAWWRRTVSPVEPRILMYHLVRPALPGARFNKMRVAPADFRRQVEWLAREGWMFCFVSELLRSAPKPGEKRVALTFDDGYRDNYTAAFPVLREFKARATLYPVVDRTPGFDWSTKKKTKHGGGELGQEPKIADAEIAEMVASGLLELGGHGLTHPNLPQLSDEEAAKEITGCKQWLEQTFKVEAPTFCYPFGLFGEREVELVRRAGFIAAVTTEEGVGEVDAFRLRRLKISGTEGMLGFKLRVRTGRRGL